MAASPLDPANISTRADRVLGRGHGTGALGPSDSSDSGSDVQGAAEELGDFGLDSDTDRNGTGERSSAAPDSEIREGADIAPDHIETYFGKAYFKDALATTHSFVKAFDIARPAIAAREAKEKFDRSEPQISLGTGIATKLGELEAQLDGTTAPRRP